MTERNIVDLAREVLEAQAAFDRDVEDAAHYGEVCDRLNEVVDRAAPDLACAVIDLIAERDAYREENTRLREQAARVKSLADRLDAEAADDFDGVSGTSVSLVKYETAKAIRTALNGETRD